MQTKRTAELTDKYLYKASTPGFSIFAVTLKPKAAGAAQPETPLQPATTGENQTPNETIKEKPAETPQPRLFGTLEKSELILIAILLGLIAVFVLFVVPHLYSKIDFD